MMVTWIRKWPRCALFISASALAGAAPSHAQTDAATTTPPEASSTLRPVERAFVLQFVENGRHEAEIARLGMSHASSSTLRDLAQQLVGDYSTLNRTFETLARRKQLPLPLQPTSISEQSREIGAAPGTGFDRAFTIAIADAAQRALRLCEQAISTAKDPDVREVAGSMLPMLRDHANRATELLRSL